MGLRPLYIFIFRVGEPSLDVRFGRLGTVATLKGLDNYGIIMK